MIEEKEELPAMTDVDALLDKGRELLDKEEYDKAIKCCDKVLEICPDSYKAWNRKGCALSSKNLHDEAIVCYDEAISLDSNDSAAWYNKGKALHYKGLQHEAIECFNEVIKLNPNYFQAWHNKASTLIEKELLDEAIECYDEAIRLNPDNINALLKVATVLKDKKLDKEAEKYLYKAYLLDTSLTLRVETAGTLKDLLGDNYKEVTHLTLTGNLNDEDLNCTEIMSYDYSLLHLDISKASIVYNKREGMFQCFDLDSIIFPDNLTTLKDFSFWGWRGIKEFNISEDNSCYVAIDGVLFSKDKTTLIVFPQTKDTNSYTIPNGVISIGDDTFRFCENLKQIIIPDSVTSIGALAFYECENLKSITIPESVAEIRGNVFCSCSNLNEIMVASENKNYSSLDGVLFNKDKTAIIRLFQAKAGRFIIPDSVTTIEHDAFGDCIGLKEIYSANPVPPVYDKNIFINSTCKLYIPKGSYSAYSKADGWEDFKNIIEK